MTQRHFVARRLGALGLLLSLVGLVSQGIPSAQTPLASPQQSAGKGDAGAPRRTVANLVAEAAPATVSITGETSDGGKTTGSGFVIDASGTLVTNLHVVEGLSRVTIRLPNGDSFERVVVRAYDEAKDIAILQVPGFSLPVVRLGNSDTVRQGDSVLLMGNPLGLTGTVSSGLISAVRQFDGYRVFQTDAAASPGNSGGPMLNDAGEVVGIFTFRITGGENLNFVVPINYARGLLQVGDSLSLAEMNSRLVGSRRVEPSTASAPPSQAEPVVGRSVTFRTLNARLDAADASRLLNALRGEVTASAGELWTVDHNHGDDNFREFCRGTLSVLNRRVVFQSQNLSESWNIPLDAVVSAMPLPRFGVVAIRIASR